MNTQEVLETYYQYVNAPDKPDWDSWLTLFDENVEIDEQVAGRFVGIDVLRGVVDGFKKGYSRFNNYPKHFVVDGDQACVVSRIEAANMGGVPIAANVCNYYRVKDGKIVYMANFHDTRPFDPFVNQKLD